MPQRESSKQDQMSQLEPLSLWASRWVCRQYKHQSRREEVNRHARTPTLKHYVNARWRAHRGSFSNIRPPSVASLLHMLFKVAIFCQLLHQADWWVTAAVSLQGRTSADWQARAQTERHQKLLGKQTDFWMKYLWSSVSWRPFFSFQATGEKMCYLSVRAPHSTW